jgi:thiol:disulfide interchange protein DsbA
VVDGKYVISPGLVAEATHTRDQQQLFQETLQVVGALVAKVQQSK